MGIWEWMLLGPGPIYLLPQAQPSFPLSSRPLCFQLEDLEACSPASMLPGLCLVWGVSDLHPPPEWVLFKCRNHPMLSFSPCPASALPKAPCPPQVSGLGWIGTVSCSGFCQGLPREAYDLPQTRLGLLWLLSGKVMGF